MHILLALILIFGLPLLGILLTGQPVGRYLEFPPRNDFLSHAPFSWTAFALIALVAAIMVGLIITGIRTADSRRERARNSPRRFPWWGWAGLGWLAIVWVLAWTRWDWFSWLQPYTYTPLWLGYTVIINALTYLRSGRSLLTDHTRHLLLLFPASAAFWWSFEYLNRFVQNWHYVGVANIGAAVYVINATISFSTVLPAVLSTAEFLRSFRMLDSPPSPGANLSARTIKFVAVLGVLVSMTIMLLLGVLPNYLFPFVWSAPLLVIVSLEAWRGGNSVFQFMFSGDWLALVRPALAAVICGFFWEMWNFHSLAHWEYTIPFVHRFKLFEMPILGYAGYLPFGLECAVIAGLIRNNSR